VSQRTYTGFRLDEIHTCIVISRLANVYVFCEVTVVEISNAVWNQRESGRRLAYMQGIVEVHGLKYTHAHY
jgi:hypothetical protein